MVDTASERFPAHRPSRRHVIIDAAVRVFARQGFVDASVQDVAEEADVVPNAIYYHFAGKEELFDAALRHAMEQIDEATENARNSMPGHCGKSSKTGTSSRRWTTSKRFAVPGPAIPPPLTRRPRCSLDGP